MRLLQLWNFNALLRGERRPSQAGWPAGSSCAEPLSRLRHLVKGMFSRYECLFKGAKRRYNHIPYYSVDALTVFIFKLFSVLYKDMWLVSIKKT
jgi:hypothetical protein